MNMTGVGPAEPSLTLSPVSVKALMLTYQLYNFPTVIDSPSRIILLVSEANVSIFRHHVLATQHHAIFGLIIQRLFINLDFSVTFFEKQCMHCWESRLWLGAVVPLNDGHQIPWHFLLLRSSLLSYTLNMNGLWPLMNRLLCESCVYDMCGLRVLSNHVGRRTTLQPTCCEEARQHGGALVADSSSPRARRIRGGALGWLQP